MSAKRRAPGLVELLTRFAVPAALAVTASACGISGVQEPSEEPGKLTFSECEGGQIEDLEDNDKQIHELEGRGGYWFTFKDTAGSTVSDFAPAAGGPGESKFAGNIKGKMADAGASLYAGIGFSIADPKRPYDASKYKGVSFWAKGPATIRFKVPDMNTDPSADRCSDCYNDFGVNLYLPAEWTRFTIPFEAMEQQPGWGDQTPGVATEGLIAVQWQFNKPGAEYDISVDDIAFVGCE